MPSEDSQSIRSLRIRVFVDFWNFTLSLRNEELGFKTDWQPIGRLLAFEAANLIDSSIPLVYEGMHVYGSYDRNKPNDARFRNWFVNTLDKMPGVHADLRVRQKVKAHPRCPACQIATEFCHSCGHDMRGTQEKGIDTRIVTDMIKLAWANAYDAAVVVSSDRDFVPVAEFLQTKGIKVVHGAFPPLGSELSQKCWASIRIPDHLEKFRRA